MIDVYLGNIIGKLSLHPKISYSLQAGRKTVLIVK